MRNILITLAIISAYLVGYFLALSILDQESACAQVGTNACPWGIVESGGSSSGEYDLNTEDLIVDDDDRITDAGTSKIGIEIGGTQVITFLNGSFGAIQVGGTGVASDTIRKKDTNVSVQDLLRLTFLTGKTSDPCTGAGDSSIAVQSIFFNSTDDVPCWCSAAGAAERMDGSTSCF